MKVGILGCGPAGLIAAHAAVQTGHEVQIFSKRRKSEMFGAQYLHAPIPGMTDLPPVEVDYRWMGSYEGYRRKVYGNLDVERMTGVKVSPEDFGGKHLAWDIRRTYDNLWSEYSDYVTDVEQISGRWVNEMLESGRYDLVISTIPAPALCWPAPDGNVHFFNSQDIYALGDAPERGIFAKDVFTVVPNTILCNGEENPSWYRAARVFGYTTIEWPSTAGRPAPPFAGVTKVGKPLNTNCDCFPSVLRLGRFGQWQKGVLVNHVWEQALTRLSKEPV